MHFILFAHVAHRLIVLFIHGCTIEDDTFVGMGATLLDGVVVKKHAVVAAGTLVRQNVWGGNPAKVPGKLAEEEIYKFCEKSMLLKMPNLLMRSSFKRCCVRSLLDVMRSMIQ
ncbi:gamma carbonic anhydrase 1, mitochondrial, partial [Olea europaea subsp. europaea]